MLTRTEVQLYFADRMRQVRAREIRVLICPTCGGRGTVARDRAGAAAPVLSIEVCGQCRGTGDAAGK
jgi:DnaJ-class molecular chaperone